MDLALFLTIIGTGITIVAFIYGFLRNFKKDIQAQFERIDKKMDKFDEKLTDIDRRLCRLEGAFSSRDCCILKEDKQVKKAE